MTFCIEKGDLFEVSGDYMLAHCISADLAVNKGIVEEFERRYGISEMLMQALDGKKASFPDCIFTETVFNLITKARKSHKPTLDSLTEALYAMRRIVEEKGIRKIAMPKIGCGLDRLGWKNVQARIHQVFDEVEDLEILVRCL